MAVAPQMTINLSKCDTLVCGSFNYGFTLPAIDQELDHLTTNGLSQLLASARALDSSRFQLLLVHPKRGFHRETPVLAKFLSWLLLCNIIIKANYRGHLRLAILDGCIQALHNPIEISYETHFLGATRE